MKKLILLLFIPILFTCSLSNAELEEWVVESMTETFRETSGLEDAEILEFHYKRWKDISSSYFILRDSYEFRIAEAQRLGDIVKPDNLLTFYNLTGISYQVVDFIHELIKLKNPDALENTFIVDYKEWLEDDDKLFSTLSKQIMLQMK